MASYQKTRTVYYRRAAEKGDKGDTGDPGEKGERGAMLRGPFEWASLANGFWLYSGADGEPYKDVVLYNGTYYSCISSHAKTESKYPGGAVDTSNGYWQTAADFELVATNILLAQYACIKNLGAEALEMYDSSGNTVFVAKDGNVTCKKGTFENVTVNGYYKSVFTKIEESDATKQDSTNAFGHNIYVVNKMLNLLRSGSQVGTNYSSPDVVLPVDSSYIGTRVTIADNLCPSDKKTGKCVLGAIYTSDESGMIGVEGGTVESPQEALAIRMASGVVELLGIPDKDGACKWCIIGFNATYKQITYKS